MLKISILNASHTATQSSLLTTLRQGDQWQESRAMLIIHFSPWWFFFFSPKFSSQLKNTHFGDWLEHAAPFLRIQSWKWKVLVCLLHHRNRQHVPARAVGQPHAVGHSLWRQEAQLVCSEETQEKRGIRPRGTENPVIWALSPLLVPASVLCATRRPPLSPWNRHPHCSTHGGSNSGQRCGLPL